MEHLPLTLQDRCDSCGSRAFVRIIFPETGYDLLLCGHHWRKNQTVIEKTGAEVLDETALLTAW